MRCDEVPHGGTVYPMPHYVIFGGCLRSELPFPELVEVQGREHDWTLRVGTIASDDDGVVLSDRMLSATCRVRLTHSRGVYRYEHSCTGRFEVSADGREIVFEPAPNAAFDVARTDVIARVLLLCVNNDNVSWLHGSAVECGDQAIAFLGASGAGKSTLALALSGAGARHICDDTVRIDLTGAPTVSPSDHTVRVCTDTKGVFAPNTSAVRRETDGKFILTHDMLAARGSSPAPGAIRTDASRLAAVYLLRPPTDAPATSAGVVAERTRLAPITALTALMPQLKLAPVIETGAPARMLRQLGALTRVVPVYELRIVRDWALIDQVVAQLVAWHPAPADGPAGVSEVA